MPLSDCARIYIAINTNIQAIYAYIGPLNSIYGLYIYVKYTYLFIYMLISFYIYVNVCKYMQIHALLHINASSNEETCP